MFHYSLALFRNSTKYIQSLTGTKIELMEIFWLFWLCSIQRTSKPRWNTHWADAIRTTHKKKHVQFWLLPMILLELLLLLVKLCIQYLALSILRCAVKNWCSLYLKNTIRHWISFWLARVCHTSSCLLPEYLIIVARIRLFVLQMKFETI